MSQNQILSSVKDLELVEKRRNQMIKGAITLFKEKGFHKTTTREIAKEAGFSIGTLYEYIRTKEDVLFLVFEAIYEQVNERLEETMDLKHPSVENLITAVTSYFQLTEHMQDEVVIMYQEVTSLKQETRAYVLEKERQMVGMLERVITTRLPHEIEKQDAVLLANNIFIHGQMWGFRRWMLQRRMTLEEYTDKQIHFLMRALSMIKSG